MVQRCLPFTQPRGGRCDSLLTQPSAHAEHVRFEDAQGDGEQFRRLDITRVGISNRDHALVVRVAFDQAARGDLIMFFSAHGDSRADQARMTNHHRPHGQDTVTLDTRHGSQDCDGLSAHWDHERDFARLRLPSRCFRSGDYGAVRVQVLTEMSVDVDFAPEGPPAQDSETGTPRRSRWVARG